MSNHGMGRHDRRRRLRSVMRRCNGRCQKCGEPVEIAGVKLAAGWSQDHKSGELVSPTGRYRIRVATLEHIIPVRDGGSNALDNLTLYCLPCNSHDPGRMHYRPAAGRPKRAGAAMGAPSAEGSVSLLAPALSTVL